MKKSIVLSAVFAATVITAVPVTLMTAQAQSVDVYVTPTQPYAPPPRGGAFGDRDRDGVPNIADNYNNNRDRRSGWGDQDRDGVPNRWDNRPNNPWR